MEYLGKKIMCHTSFPFRGTEIDCLTKLPNRCGFEKYMAAAIKQSQKNNSHRHALMIDIDNTRKVNRAFGYETGDKVIFSTAMFLARNFHTAYDIFHLFSDIFVLVSKQQSKPSLEEAYFKIKSRFEKPWHIDQRVFYNTVSISATYFPTHCESVKEVYCHLDSAMVSAKKTGRNKMVIYSEEIENMSEKMEHQYAIEKTIYDAIQNNFKGFEVFFQPIHQSESWSINSAEALLRFTNDKGERLSPGDFIPIAEKTGMIEPIGEYVLRKAAEVCKTINEQVSSSFMMHVNVSVTQLELDNFPDRIVSILEEVGTNKSNIILEITESSAAENYVYIKDICDKLQQHGVGFALDDFGTGFSSLNLIGEMPLDIIKIDKSFIQCLTHDHCFSTLLTTITKMGHALGKTVCAEGVETQEQFDCCKRVGVDCIQGYYFNQALSESALYELAGTSSCSKTDTI